MVSMRVRDRESIQEAVRRFRKLVERSGLKREVRRRQYYEKPSETNRRARLRAQRRAVSDRRIKTELVDSRTSGSHSSQEIKYGGKKFVLRQSEL